MNASENTNNINYKIYVVKVIFRLLISEMVDTFFFHFRENVCKFGCNFFIL